MQNPVKHVKRAINFLQSPFKSTGVGAWYFKLNPLSISLSNKLWSTLPPAGHDTGSWVHGHSWAFVPVKTGSSLCTATCVRGEVQTCSSPGPGLALRPSATWLQPPGNSLWDWRVEGSAWAECWGSFSLKAYFHGPSVYEGVHDHMWYTEVIKHT